VRAFCKLNKRAVPAVLTCDVICLTLTYRTPDSGFTAIIASQWVALRRTDVVGSC